MQAIDRIDECGDGIGMKQPDWRAKAFLLQSVLKPEVFGAQAGQGTQGQAVNMITDDSMARVLAMLKASQPQKQVIDIAEVKQLKQGD